MKKILLLVCIVLFFGCNEKKHLECNVIETVSPKFTNGDIAKFAIATLTNESEQIMDVTNEGEKYFVSYNRKSDSEKLKYKVKFEYGRIIWGTINGRWKKGHSDIRVKYRKNKNTLMITLNMSDGSMAVREFTKKN
ncbi:hypothetical protein HYN48_13775 [Flavobacterium magnum]|uniref:Lipoprotein n=1 Tax=Flavobacterium magnum TaxID=2162713 RepID=A0A2S0RIL9_9FLAO|nr:hypothetical protein [Flavobacterium magnum]AWA31068.1 hypothetical protein HYN48_13775 [Flavobacterium magnum]